MKLTKMNKLIYLLCTTCLIQVTCKAQEQKKNVLFLVVDDLNTWLLQKPDRYTPAFDDIIRKPDGFLPAQEDMAHAIGR